MSTSSTTPACEAPGSISRPGFQVPNVIVTSAWMAAPAASPVSASMPLGRSTATTRPAARCAAAASDAAGSRRPPRPPIPSSPSMTRSAAAITACACWSAASISRPPGAAQRGGPALVDTRSRADGCDHRAAGREPGTGVQGVPAVVPAARQHGHARSVDRSEQARAGRRQAGRGTLHQRALRQQRHQFGFGRADLGHGVCVSHPSATTIATHIPPSWLSERCQVRMPSRVAASATLPLTWSNGRPTGLWSDLHIGPQQTPQEHRAPSRRPPWQRRPPSGRRPTRFVRPERTAAGQRRGSPERFLDPGDLRDVDADAHDHGSSLPCGRHRSRSTRPGRCGLCTRPAPGRGKRLARSGPTWTGAG